MNSARTIVRGIIKEDGSLELLDRPHLPPGPVWVVLQPSPQPGPERPGLLETLEEIWEGQRARGYKGRSREEIDAEIAADRAAEEEYEERWRQIWAQTENPPPPNENR